MVERASVYALRVRIGKRISRGHRVGFGWRKVREEGLSGGVWNSAPFRHSLACHIYPIRRSILPSSLE
jgi:hypothetical protein